MGPGRAAALIISLTVAAVACAPDGGEITEPRTAAEPTTSTTAPLPRRVLAFSGTTGFRHTSIPTAIATVRALGAEAGFDVDATEDPAAFTATNLARYGAVIFLLTSGDVLDATQQGAFEQHLSGGAGFVGVHSAADTEYEWPFYARTVGAQFARHPAPAPATVIVDDPTHPSTAHLPAQWKRTDEWYDFRTNPRGSVHVLLRLDESTYAGGGMGADHPISWCHAVDAGRAWYTGLGHGEDAYAEPLVRRHLLGGIEWALGGPGACGK